MEGYTKHRDNIGTSDSGSWRPLTLGIETESFLCNQPVCACLDTLTLVLLTELCPPTLDLHHLPLRGSFYFKGVPRLLVYHSGSDMSLLMCFGS